MFSNDKNHSYSPVPCPGPSSSMTRVAGSSVSLSIVVPVFNVANYIERAIASICRAIARSEEDVRVVLVDDASTDGSIEIAENVLANQGTQYSVVSADENVGVGQARRLGRLAVDTDFLWFVDPDDQVEEDSVKTILRHANQAPPKTILEFPVVEWIDDSDRVLRVGYFIEGEERTLRSRVSQLTDALMYGELLLLRRVPGVLWTKVFPTELLTVERVDTSRQSEDISTLFRVLDEDCHILMSPESVYQYRLHGASVTQTPGYQVRSASAYAQCALLASKSEWFGPHLQPSLDYFIASRIVIPRLQLLATSGAWAAFRDDFVRTTREIPFRSLVGFWRWRHLPIGRTKWMARVLIFSRILGPVLARAYFQIWTRHR